MWHDIFPERFLELRYGANVLANNASQMIYVQSALTEFQVLVRANSLKTAVPPYFSLAAGSSAILDHYLCRIYAVACRQILKV